MDRVVLVKTVQDVEQMPHPFLSLISGISASSHPSQFNIYGEPKKRKKEIQRAYLIMNTVYTVK